MRVDEGTGLILFWQRNVPLFGSVAWRRSFHPNRRTGGCVNPKLCSKKNIHVRACCGVLVEAGTCIVFLVPVVPYSITWRNLSGKCCSRLGGWNGFGAAGAAISTFTSLRSLAVLLLGGVVADGSPASATPLDVGESGQLFARLSVCASLIPDRAEATSVKYKSSASARGVVLWLVPPDEAAGMELASVNTASEVMRLRASFST